MKTDNKTKFLIIILLGLAISLSACTGRASMTAAGWAGIVTDEETAYVAYNTQVVAVNLNNGTERWRFPAEADSNLTFYAPPAMTEKDTLIVGGYDNILYEINKANGQGTPLFEGAEGRYIGGSLVTENNIYAPSADHKLYGLDLNGRQSWSFETKEPLWAKPSIDPECDCIYLPSMDHKVYALDAGTGSLIWQTEDLGGSIVGTPKIEDNLRLFVGTFAKEMIALEVDSGDVLWRFSTNDWVWSGPALDNGVLYFGDLSGTFYAVNSETGESLWQVQPGGSIVGTPLVREDGIYFTTTNGSLVSVNPEGAIQWNQPFEASLQTGPVDNGDAIFVVTSNPETFLIAYDPSGVQKWTFVLE
jgi:outer membrane protein assembly factor BamB